MTKLIVRRAGWALKFHRNVCGQQSSMVPDTEATQFDGIHDAQSAIRAARLTVDNLTIEPITLPDLCATSS